MCRRKQPASAVAVLLMALASFGAATPQAIVSGAVRDADAGAPMVGVNVALVELGRATTTDSAGLFVFHAVPPGTYTLRATFVGFVPGEFSFDAVAGAPRERTVHLHRRPIELADVLVQGDQARSAASSRSVRRFDLQIRPRRTAQHLLQIVPGLVVAQHGGGGKAEQIYLRGFDNDHGTDVAISVDGVPVNMVSHGHGQGYADLHYVIPETVEDMEVYKGPYFARFGDLSNAGQVLLRTRDRLDHNAIRVEGGAFAERRATLLYGLPTTTRDRSIYFAGDYLHSDGPFDDPQDLQRLTLFAKGTWHLGDYDLATSFAATGSQWNQSGQIPLRAVQAGTITRWGAIDDTEGGDTSRRQIVVELRAADDGGDQIGAHLWLIDYGFRLYSNFTFYRLDPIFGDAIEQSDDRVVAGFESHLRRQHSIGPLLATTTVGSGLRADDINLSMWQVISRRRYWPIVDARARERNLYLWGEEELTISPALRLILGLRGDLFTFDVDDDMEVRDGWVKPVSEWLKDVRARGKPAHVPLVQPYGSGIVQQGILSPKASLVVSPRRGLDLFLNFGLGFHSNDARSVVMGQLVRQQTRVLEDLGARPEEIQAVLDTLRWPARIAGSEILPRSVGGELGLRSHTRRASFGAALWWIDLEEEYIYAADVAIAEHRGRTRRIGLDLEVRGQLLGWLWADADVNLSRGRLRDAERGKNHIPLAPTRTATSGLTVRRSDWRASLRARYVGDRPADEEDLLTATGHFLLNANLALVREAYRVEFSAENLLDSAYREAQFATESLLPGPEKAAAWRGPPPPADINFTPGSPFGVRVGLTFLYP